MELVRSVTISKDFRIWIDGKALDYYLAPSGPVVMPSDDGRTQVLVLPVLLAPEAIVSDLREDV